MSICIKATKKFYEYIYINGRKITVETNHKPLWQIFEKSIKNCRARFAKNVIAITKLSFEIVHKRGKDLILPEALSKACLSNT